ncbi:glycosyltransferase [Acidianus ambivalens]|uniref:Glycosyltransferase n=1 Tax=Acidianus ambivalens TaxID=2283 RepID=A0A650CX53_ACIAM|nr:glycosyltransferase family 2 protein [Acidianus ambivalens]MQL54560.1 glycosyltransferase [Acidianus ambivalens]QGR22368.1 glycosyltransferase [Acidianus ambivalens]
MNSFSVITQIIVFVIPSLILLYQYIFFKLGYNRIDVIDANPRDLPLLSIIVPTKGERPELIQGLLDNLAEVDWDKSKMEVIIVSDDSPEYFEEMKEKIIPPQGLEVRMYRRDKKLGFKSGALAYGFERSRGDLILTLDVDARVRKDSIKKAYLHMLQFGCDAVTMKWIGYSHNGYSLLAKGIMVSTIIADNSILRGRDRANLKVFPVGCGTMFKRSAIEEVGPWDYNMIQDDLEIGARLINRGKRICSSDSIVFVEVPDNLLAFYIQQTRWAMGSIEVLTRRFKQIITSKANILQKIDALLFLLQYVPIALTFIAALLISVYSFLDKGDPLNSIPLFTLWAIALGIYAYNFIKVARDSGIKLIEALRSLGKISAYTVSISPFITLSIFSAFKKSRNYIITPKGKAGKTKIVYIILAFGVLFLSASINYLLHQEFISGLWLLYYSLAYIFTFSSYKQEIK